LFAQPAAGISLANVEVVFSHLGNSSILQTEVLTKSMEIMINPFSLSKKKKN